MDYSLILEQIKNVKDVNGHEALLKSIVDQLNPQDFEQLVQDSKKKSNGEKEIAIKTVVLLCLGICYKYGIGCEVNNDESMNYLMKSARQGNHMALYELAERYRKGDGVKKNLNKAISWYAKAAEHGYADAQIMETCDILGIPDSDEYFEDLEITDAGSWVLNEIGLDLYKSGKRLQYDPEEAYDYFMQAANNGFLPAFKELGLCHYYGRGVDKNIKYAFYWFSEAANKGDEKIQYFLGEAYETGKDVDKNPTEAVKWFLKAAEKGYFPAYLKLGKIYYDGGYVERDLDEAMKWLNKVRKNNKEANELIEKINKEKE